MTLWGNRLVEFPSSLGNFMRRLFSHTNYDIMVQALSFWRQIWFYFVLIQIWQDVYSMSSYRNSTRFLFLNFKEQQTSWTWQKAHIHSPLVQLGMCTQLAHNKRQECMKGAAFQQMRCAPPPKKFKKNGLDTIHAFLNRRILSNLDKHEVEWNLSSMLAP